MASLTESSLIFSSASTALRDTLTEIKRNNLSVQNRLQSIYLDAQYVQSVAESFHLPLVANERCGSWYTAPESTKDSVRGKRGSVYFKSTDGHFGQWSFSLRRLNLHILDLIGQEGGCIIVDSTRRGKSMPDALSKTIPIWVAVLNRLLFPAVPESHLLQTPHDVVSRSEHAQIIDRLETFVNQIKSLQIDLDGLRSKVRHRWISIVWQRPGDSDQAAPDHENKESITIVLCTASNRASTETYARSDYVQGAADDHENWGLGLDAATFWQHSEQLLAASNDELPDLIASLVSDKPEDRASFVSPVVIKPSTFIWVANNSVLRDHLSRFDFIISCSTTPDHVIQTQLGTRYVVLPCQEGKIGSRQLRKELHRILSLGSTISGLEGSNTPQILITSEGAIDLAIGVALAFICSFCTGEGAFDSRAAATTRVVDKTMIKHRLSWIMIALPHAKLSRATLQSVNAFLMGS